MTTELRFLAASIILGLLQLIAASHLISFQYGYRWTASDRDEPVPPLRGLANRIDQATTNFLEYGVGRYLLIPHYVVQLVQLV